MTTQANRQELADLMDARRQELGLTWDEVAAGADMSREGLRRVREGGRNMRPLTKSGIERALSWTPGSVDAILEGGEPTPLRRTVYGAARAVLDGQATARGEVRTAREIRQEKLARAKAELLGDIAPDDEAALDDLEELAAELWRLTREARRRRRDEDDPQRDVG